MVLFIKKVRSDVTNLKWIGQQNLPDLAKALSIDPSPNQHGVAIKIGYDLHGKPVEEAFFGVYYLNKSGNPAIQAGHEAIASNQFMQTNWGFQALQSFRAAGGTLDKHMPVYCLIAKSVHYELQWTMRYQVIQTTLNQMFNQKLKQGLDEVNAAAAIADQALRNNDQFLENIGRQEMAMRNSGGGSGGSVDGSLRDEGGRSSTDHFSDLLRGVDTVNDSSTGGTTQLDNSGGYNIVHAHMTGNDLGELDVTYPGESTSRPVLRGTVHSDGVGKTERGLARVDSAPAVAKFMADPRARFAHPFYWAPFILMGNGQ